MKRYYTLIVTLTVFANSFFCLTPYCQHMKQEVVRVEKMSKEQQAAWNSLFNAWQENVFLTQLKKLHYKQDCIDCADIYFVVRFSVNENGRLLNYNVIHREIDCR